MFHLVKLHIAFTIAIFFSGVKSENTYSCNARINEIGTVCVCNSTYCDTVPPLTKLIPGSYQLYTTSQENAGFHSILGQFTTNQDAADINIVVDHKVPVANHSILGFGGAFTDSAGYNILSLPEDAQNNLMSSYFGEDGIEYTFGRIPMGGVDFSLRLYSYADEEDPTLSNFALQEEDFAYKIPLALKAKELKNGKEFKLFGSVWTAPPWMKSSNNWTCRDGAYLKEEYYQTWANYFMKFFEAYLEQGLEFWGVTNQNEPLSGQSVSFNDFPCMAWSTQQMNNWVGTNLGPTIRNSNFNNLKIMIHDDQRAFLPQLQSDVLNNATTLQYIDGVAVHYYADAVVSKDYLNYAKTDKKDLFLLATEACAGFKHAAGLEDAVSLGNWTRAEQYLRSIFEDLSEGAVGWVDWNMALNTEGGPLVIQNSVDSPVIVNATAGEFYKQPMFYALGHFSKFVIPDSVLIKSELTNSENKDVQALAFLRPDNIVAVVIWNASGEDVTVCVRDLGVKNSALLNVKAKSLNTILFSTN